MREHWKYKKPVAVVTSISLAFSLAVAPGVASARAAQDGDYWTFPTFFGGMRMEPSGQGRRSRKSRARAVGAPARRSRGARRCGGV